MSNVTYGAGIRQFEQLALGGQSPTLCYGMTDCPDTLATEVAEVLSGDIISEKRAACPSVAT